MTKSDDFYEMLRCDWTAVFVFDNIIVDKQWRRRSTVLSIPSQVTAVALRIAQSIIVEPILLQSWILMG